MITIYGIKNCDVVQKALKWLSTHNVPYTFHDYKEEGIAESTLDKWLLHFPLNKLVNLKSTTYRELSEAEKEEASDKASAIQLMMTHNSIIKRPVWDLGDGTFYLGWNEIELANLLRIR